ncbi:LuxR C-terminal-related transcriptional regulator [Chloroflexota bacterium]
MAKTRVLLIFRTELFREGLAKLLEEREHLEVVGTCGGAQGVQKAIKLAPDIVLLDAESTEPYVEIIQGIMRKLPGTRILILTRSDEDPHLLAALRAGARAYLAKATSVEDLIGAIDGVCAGEVIITASVAERLITEFTGIEESRKLVEDTPETHVSKREREVLSLVAKGFSNRVIASTLFISENTVKVHLSSILEKLHVHSRYEAAMLAKEMDMESS